MRRVAWGRYLLPGMGNSAVGWGAIAIAAALKREGPAAMAEALAGLRAKAEAGRVVIVHGTGDRWLGPAPPAEALPAARRVLVEEAGHFVGEDFATKAAEVLARCCA